MLSCARERLEPFYTNDTAGQVLNPELDLVPAPDFFRDATTGLYTSADPRLYDVQRNVRTAFASPPVQPANVQPLTNVACAPCLTRPTYDDYEDIRLGNVSYYTTLFEKQVFAAPVYQIRSDVEATVMTDPMGALKPYYEKAPLTQEAQMLSPYSFDQDQLFFREDLMSRQSSLMDRKSYHKFHSFFDA